MQNPFEQSMNTLPDTWNIHFVSRHKIIQNYKFVIFLSLFFLTLFGLLFLFDISLSLFVYAR